MATKTSKKVVRKKITLGTIPRTYLIKAKRRLEKWKERGYKMDEGMRRKAVTPIWEMMQAKDSVSFDVGAFLKAVEAFKP